jgi:hypothetical protein
MATADKTIRFVVSAAASMPSWYPASAGQVIDLSAALGQSTTIFSFLDALNVFALYPSGTDSRRIDIYSGGALIYESGRPFIHAFGGGHNDGSWNGTMKYGPLWGSGANTPVWSIGATPSPPGSIVFGSSTGLYADGKPSSQHTYNLLVGIGSRMWCPAPGVSYSNGSVNASGPPTPHYWESATDTWTFPAYPAYPTPPGVGAGGGVTAYNGNLYLYKNPGDPQRLRVFNIAAGTWSMDSNDTTLAGDSTALAVDTRRGALLAIASGTAYDTGAYWPNLANLSIARRTGIAAPPSLISVSLEYDYDRDAFVVPSTSAASVFELSASSLASGGSPSWTTRTFSGPTPTNTGPQGLAGRFRAIPELKGYISVPGSQSSVYFYRSA